MKMKRFMLVLLGLTATSTYAGGWCWNAAAAAQNVSPIVLRAIAKQETDCGRTNFNPASKDHGPIQINR